MVLYLRTIFTLLKGLLPGKRSGLLDEFTSSYRVQLNDTDIPKFDGMSNGRYFNIMDLARVEHVVRIGLFKQMLRNRWYILVGGQCIRYKKKLRRWQKYTVRSRILCWDEKWFYVQQQFERKGELYSIGVVRALFRGKNGNVPPSEIIASIGHTEPSPAMPPFVREWIQADNRLHPF